MHLKSQLGRLIKQLPGGKKLHATLKARLGGVDDYLNLDGRSSDELLSVVRHEAHRIEKSIYNDNFESKKEVYEKKRDTIEDCFKILRQRDFDLGEDPTAVWAENLIASFNNLENYVLDHSREAAQYRPERAAAFAAFARSRRSCRVWADEQPDDQELAEIAGHMIDAARWAPTSGNRQPWRFVVLSKPERKELLRGIKEQHCISAPLLIWVLMDKRLYGALGNNECSLFIDAGAAIMQMVLAAHDCGLGVCWNHFALDMIRSRPSNMVVYDRLTRELGVDDHLESVAIVAIGRPKFIPPEPQRVKISDLTLAWE
ncbi:malonic semialdehyde reductase [Rubripirellula obstinata]|uniref:Malonic semialdehyde reductase n=1 Tax=Rubripirellula obstinata TaxID=406547 RepID=A0A5B1CHR4_9BACT|nr:nitroreductase family protein [Rubripirellula obstinata]KAA1258794.1 malonic semialdehyde reductase [Rubripirellula obstinata]